MQKLGLKGKVHAGGFDLTEQTQNLIKAGFLEFTIDQQPYLQGFVPALELFFYLVSGTTTGPFEANTGLKFVTPETVAPYLTKSRYEGTTASVVVVKA
jgi:simple sugar transport system substrate-binding protein